MLDFSGLDSLWQKYHVRRAMVFGSILRSDFNPDSDVDLLVEYEPTARITLLDMAALQREMSEVVGRPVDLGTPRSLSPYIRDRVLSEAQIIYERE